jgi:hypothetical protein
MGTTFRFLATVDEGSAVLDWFRALPELPVETPHDAGAMFHFQDFGPLVPDSGRSPVVNVFLPTRRRGALVTVGEVHFLATPLSMFPGLHRVSKQFHAWLRQRPCVFSRRPAFVGEWDYFLEGGVRNFDADIFAMPGGLAALRQGEYFVSENDSGHTLDLVCRRLQLRGVPGVELAEPNAAADGGV